MSIFFLSASDLNIKYRTCNWFWYGLIIDIWRNLVDRIIGISKNQNGLSRANNKNEFSPVDMKIQFATIWSQHRQDRENQMVENLKSSNIPQDIDCITQILRDLLLKSKKGIQKYPKVVEEKTKRTKLQIQIEFNIMHERANDDIFYIEDLTRLLEPKILGHNEKTSNI